MTLQRADWVCCKGQSQHTGIVKRVARDGSWADVDWGSHRKRMRTDVLSLVDTLSLRDGWQVTDLKAQRRAECEA